MTNDMTSNPYANEPGFTHVQRPSQSNDESSFTEKKDINFNIRVLVGET